MGKLHCVILSCVLFLFWIDTATASFVDVSAKAKWVNTGVVVNPQDSVIIMSVEGLWKVNDEHPIYYGADGYQQGLVAPNNGLYPLPGVLEGTMVGRMGRAGTVFKVGAQFNQKISLSTADTLLLMTNDDTTTTDPNNGLSDNSGSIVASITIIPAVGICVEVPATVKWVNTRVIVKPQDSLFITSTGFWKVNAGHPFKYGADGYLQGALAPNNGLYPLPGVLEGTLVGRVGSSGTIFSVGTSFAKQMGIPVADTLFLMTNDDTTTTIPGKGLSDNWGSVIANILIRNGNVGIHNNTFNNNIHFEKLILNNSDQIQIFTLRGQMVARISKDIFIKNVGDLRSILPGGTYIIRSENGVGERKQIIFLK